MSVDKVTMNVVKSLFSRGNGYNLVPKYDIALGRLKCYDYDEFRGISPSTEGPDFNPEPPVFACTFSTTPGQEHLLALANEDGKIAIQDTNVRSDHNPFEGHQAHHNAIFDIAWAPQEMRLVSASGDHTAVLWDVAGSSQLQEISRFQAHTRSVKTVVFPQDEKTVFATGARDGVIMIWDTRLQNNQAQIRPDNFIVNSHSAPGTPGNTSTSRNRRTKSAPSRASSITGLVFQDSYHLISCGAGDGKVKVWDLRKSYSSYRREPKPQYSLSAPKSSARNGFTSLTLDPGLMKLYASCMDNTVYCYNVATYEEQPVALFTGHKNSTYYVKACLSPDGRYLLSGSSDEHAYIWDTSASPDKLGQPLVKLTGHGAEVTSVAWCPVGQIRIVTCSDDARHCLWRVGLEHEGDNDQVELHGWAEEVVGTSRKVLVPTTPVTPATPSFTSLRRWAPCVERTPDIRATPCQYCLHMTTPCVQCIAKKAPLPATASVGSKKRLETLWEKEESSSVSCLECAREVKQSSNTADVPARRLFSPSKSRQTEQSSSKVGLECSSDQLCSSPHKRQSNSVGSASPRKQIKLSTDRSPQKSPVKRVRSEVQLDDHSFTSPSPRKRLRVDGGESSQARPLDQPDQSVSPSKRSICTPTKRRISERITGSPHKRLRPSDDLQGIAKIEDAGPSSSCWVKSSNHKLCSRHRVAGLSSPTLNLPNYVMDGTSPHHKCSSARKQKENVDWLTKLRKERTSTEKRPDSSSSSSQVTPARPSLGAQTSPSRHTPAKTSGRTTPTRSLTPSRSEKKPTKRRTSGSEGSSTSSALTGSESASKESLLRFFRISSKTCEQQCSSGTPTSTPVNTPVS